MPPAPSPIQVQQEKKHASLRDSFKRFGRLFKRTTSKGSIQQTSPLSPVVPMVSWDSGELMYDFDPESVTGPCALSDAEVAYRSGPPVLMHPKGSTADWRAGKHGTFKAGVPKALPAASPYESCPNAQAGGQYPAFPVQPMARCESGELVQSFSSTNGQKIQVVPNSVVKWGTHKAQQPSKDNNAGSSDSPAARAHSLSGLPQKGLRVLLLKPKAKQTKVQQAQVQYSEPNSPVVPADEGRSTTDVQAKGLSYVAHQSSAPGCQSNVHHKVQQHPANPASQALTPSPLGPLQHDTEVQQEDTEEAQAEKPAAFSQLLGVCQEVPAAMKRSVWLLEDYTIIKRVYKGHTSSVYEATCNLSNARVALKVYFLDQVPDNMMHMLRREVDLHIQLCHVNIAMLYGAFMDDSHVVLVQEFCGRGDLFGIHRKLHGRMPEADVVDVVMRPFLEALDYLHVMGICHRDIKPENILFTQDWTLKLADFGVSIDLSTERAVTRTGTTDYMAPEVERCPLKARHEDNKDDASLAYSTEADIWSLGVLCYELLVGFPPIVTPKKKGAPAAIMEDEEEEVDRESVANFIAEQANRHTLRFPASISDPARDFIKSALAEFPGDRPTALQLKNHTWLCSE